MILLKILVLFLSWSHRLDIFFDLFCFILIIFKTKSQQNELNLKQETSKLNRKEQHKFIKQKRRTFFIRKKKKRKQIKLAL